jgi:hypothetical protein
MSISWETPDFYERHNDLAIRDLAAALRTGALSLMVGSGISKDLKLPLWHELVATCCDKAGIDNKGINANSTGDSLLLRMESVRQSYLGDDARYLDDVTDALYDKWKNPSISKAPELMRAIGVLVMGSVRGRIKTIVNFNFDSLLEWYLAYHGYVIQVIEDVPRNLLDADVHIFHPHGYLPLETKFGNRSDMILFDKREAESRTVNQNEPWMNVFRFVLGTQIFLAVGLSGRDPMAQMVTAAADRQRRVTDKAPLGFWFVKKGSLDDDYKTNLHNKKIVLIETDTYGNIAEMLFKIGREASGAILT